MIITKVRGCLGCGKPLENWQLEKRSAAKFCSIECSRKYASLRNYKRTYNENFIKDKKILGYFLGFWVADGHISSSPASYGTVYLTTSSKQLINDFVAATGYIGAIVSRAVDAPRSSPFHINHIQYVLHYTGAISKYIQSIGYLPGKKRGKEFLPMEIDDEMFPHFLRGFIDGDGSIYHDTGSVALGYPKYLHVSLFCSNRRFVVDMHKRLADLAIVRGGGISLRKKTFVLHYGHADAVRICNYIYADAPIKLERKYQKYIDCKDLVLEKELQFGNCTYEGCTRLAMTKGLCKKHFNDAYHQLHKDDPEVREKAYQAVLRYRENHADEHDSLLARRRELYKEAPKKHRQAVQTYREQNRDKVIAYKQEYRQTHKETINEYKKRYRQENPELHKEMDHRKYEKNKEKTLAKSKENYQKNKEKVKARAAAYREKKRQERAVEQKEAVDAGTPTANNQE